MIVSCKQLCMVRSKTGGRADMKTGRSSERIDYAEFKRVPI